jgi:Holliday junction resolvase RusA-like endonuclease
MAQNYGHQILELIDPSKDPTVIFALHLTFYLDCINESWDNPNFSPSKRASSRYKRVDLSNRIKLLEDCLKYSVVLDDSLTFSATQEKVHDPTSPRVRIELVKANPELFGIPPPGVPIP